MILFVVRDAFDLKLPKWGNMTDWQVGGTVNDRHRRRLGAVAVQPPLLGERRRVARLAGFEFRQ